MESLIQQLLHSSNITHINKDDLKLQLLSHNEYPSLKAITDTLDYFAIENLAAHVPKDSLEQLPKRFLAIVSGQQGDELVLIKQKKNSIEVTSNQLKNKSYSYDQFSSLWNGTIIAVEESKQPQLTPSTNSKQIIIAALITITSILIILQNKLNWQHTVYTLLSLLGFYVSFLITKESLGLKDVISSKVCNTISTEKQGCNAVISSSKNSIIKNFNLSDACLIYFGSLSLTCFIVGIDSSLLLVVSAVSIPVIIYAIYAQALVLKKWCALCLIISGILLTQFAILAVHFTEFTFSFEYLSKVILVVFLTSVVWFTLKKLWQDSLNLKKTKQEFYTFKRNPAFFNFALSERQLSSDSTIPKKHRLIFGNAQAPLKIIAITNPFCGYCKEPFEEYIKILSRYENVLSLEVVLSVAQDPENKATQIALRIIELYNEDKLEALKALDLWYTHKDVDLWFKKYPTSQHLIDNDLETIASHNSWCKEQAINYTPETIINNYIYPKESYKISDLILFIEDLKEEQSQPYTTVTI